jgi:protein-S-isoprenylcysteine O-methyltransferase Ste14
MDKKLFLILVIVCIATHVIRTIYEILKYKKILKANQLTFVIMLINMLALWVSWFLLCAFDIHKIELFSLTRILGISLFGIGVLIFFVSLFTIKTLESYEGDLITKGIYSIIRHPMYLGFILWLTGLPIFFGSLFAICLALLFIANILFWRYLEEKELVIRYPSYNDYKKKTLF